MTPCALLLPLAGHEVDVLSDALVAFAQDADLVGDPAGIAHVADDLAERLRSLRPLAHEPAEQTLRGPRATSKQLVTVGP